VDNGNHEEAECQQEATSRHQSQAESNDPSVVYHFEIRGH